MSHRKKVLHREKWRNVECSVTAYDVARVQAAHTGFELPNLSELTPVEVKRFFSRGPCEFAGSQDFLRYHQVRALVTKVARPGYEVQSRKKAQESFEKSELSCKRVNKRLSHFFAHPDRENPVYRVILSRARELISRLLGEFTPRVLEHLISLSHPGSGVCIGTPKARRFETTREHKFGNHSLVCTPAALPYARMMVESSQIWVDSIVEHFGELRYTIVPANRVSFVAKDATTDRTIAVEPHLNVMLQLGVHEYLSARLKSVGIDLGDQSRNQEAARKGSSQWRDWNPQVTIDLSAASDSLSIELVRRLLPSAWFGYLNDIRSPCYLDWNGTCRDYHKWSSMGNGYTFVLETIVFWALARASQSLCESSDVNPVIYGDDIAVQRSYAALTLEVLKYVGFRANSDKTFIFGPFRESCGADWWDGVNVTPVYIRGRWKLRHTDVYRIVNRLPHLAPTLLQGLENVVYGLENEDDTSCVFVSLEEAMRRKVVWWDKRTQGYKFLRVLFRPSLRSARQIASYCSFLSGSRSPFGLRFKEESVLLSIRRKGHYALVRSSPGVSRGR